MTSIRLRRRIRRVIQKFEKTKGQAAKALAKAEKRRIENRRDIRLSNTPIEALNQVSQGKIRLAALRNARMQTIADVKAKKRILPNLSGVGPKTLQRITYALALLDQIKPEDALLPSDPDEWNDVDEEYVQTLMWSEDIDRAEHSDGPLDRARLVLKSPPPTFFGRLFSRQKSTQSDHKPEITNEQAEELLLILIPLIDALQREQWRAIYGRSSLIERWNREAANLTSAAENKSQVATPFVDVRGGDVSLLPEELLNHIESINLQLPGFKRPLRKYQEFGARFVLAAEGSILGDEMGLGKTVEALAVAHHLSRSKEKFRAVVVAPASLMENWRRETLESTDVAPIVLHGDNRIHGMAQWNSEGGLGITSYQSLRSIADKFGWAPDLVIVDEAHKIKNPIALQTIATRELLNKSEYRLLLSGTPLENKTKEFIFLAGIVNSSIGSQLQTNFGDGQSAHLAAIEFRRMIAPCYLRRNQVEVLKELPEMQIVNERIELSPAEYETYKAAVANESIPAIRISTTISAGQSSSKVQRLAELLDDYRETGQKVLVFSFFLDVLTTVQELVGPECLRLDGSLTPLARQAVLDDFTSRSGFAVIAMQIEAGGVGLNLQAASVVVIMEPQFKPSTENQAIKRAHRMGQTRTVMVHRLLANNTIDERLEDRLKTKERLFEVIARPSTLAESSDEALDTEVLTDIQLLSIEKSSGGLK